jgi:hypothetical protein
MSNEWELQNSLTSPSDKVANAPVSYNLGAPNLSEQEVKSAMQELNVNTFVQKFPRFERFYADPQLQNQNYALLSFVPSKGASPDQDGVYGMLKVRGTFSSEDEAMLRAEYLIRNGDSYHSIYSTYVGRPFPLAATKKYITDTTEVDIKKKIVDSTSTEIRKKRDEERQTMKEIQEREKELLADVEKKEVDPYDSYTELMVKKAQLTWTYHQTLIKMEEMKKNIIKTRDEVSKMREENEDYHAQYYQRYMDARQKAGLPSNDDSFIKYMAEDLDLGF